MPKKRLNKRDRAIEFPRESGPPFLTEHLLWLDEPNQLPENSPFTGKQYFPFSFVGWRSIFVLALLLPLTIPIGLILISSLSFAFAWLLKQLDFLYYGHYL